MEKATPPTSRRNPRTVVAILAALLVVTAAVAGSLYVQGLNRSATISSKNSSVSSLQSELVSEAAAAASLEGNLSALNAQVSSLNNEVANLETNNSTSVAEIHSLQTQISRLQNESALLNEEATLVWQVGGYKAWPIGINITVTVQPNSTMLLTEQVNQYNGSLIFLGSSCPDGAGTASNADGSAGYTVLLNSRSLIPSSSQVVGTVPSTAKEWYLYLDNIGPTTVECTSSVYYVYQVPPSF